MHFGGNFYNLYAYKEWKKKKKQPPPHPVFLYSLLCFSWPGPSWAAIYFVAKVTRDIKNSRNNGRNARAHNSALFLGNSGQLPVYLRSLIENTVTPTALRWLSKCSQSDWVIILLGLVDIGSGQNHAGPLGEGRRETHNELEVPQHPATADSAKNGAERVLPAQASATSQTVCYKRWNYNN